MESIKEGIYLKPNRGLLVSLAYVTKVKAVKLNLFNYVLVLFLVKFACNSTFRNTILR